MQEKRGLSGVIAPVLTPFGEDGAPDVDRFVEHCEWLLDEGCTALAPFGTTSEAPSLGLDERMELLDELLDAGIEPAKLMPGTGAASLADAITLTGHAVDAGCAGVLVLPPFYFKTPSEEGIYRYYSELIEEIGDNRLKLHLYHIPQLSGVAITPSLIERLVGDYPDEVVGLKDSSGDLANTRELLQRFPELSIFPGSERNLLELMRLGAVGCISGTCNVASRQIRQLYDNVNSAGAESLQADVAALRASIQNVELIPALKSLIAHYRNDAQWRVVRAPLVELEMGAQRELVTTLEREHGFGLTFPEGD